MPAIAPLISLIAVVVVIAMFAGLEYAFVAIPPPLGRGLLGFLALASAVAAIVYLVDVRPAITPYSGRGGGRPGGRPGGSW